MGVRGRAPPALTAPAVPGCRGIAGPPPPPPPPPGRHVRGVPPARATPPLAWGAVHRRAAPRLLAIPEEKAGRRRAPAAHLPASPPTASQSPPSIGQFKPAPPFRRALIGQALARSGGIPGGNLLERRDVTQEPRLKPFLCAPPPPPPAGPGARGAGAALAGRDNQSAGGIEHAVGGWELPSAQSPMAQQPARTPVQAGLSVVSNS